MYFKLFLILLFFTGLIFSDDPILKMGVSIKGGVITHVAPPSGAPEPQAQATPAPTPPPAPTSPPAPAPAPTPAPEAKK